MEKQILPLLALRGKMVYPNTSVYFEVSRPKSMAALEQAVNHEQRIFLVNQIDPSLDKPEEEDLYTVGTVAKILQMVKAGQGVLRVFVEGEARARITSYIEFDGCVKVEVEEIPDTNYPENPVEEEAFFRMLEEEAQEFSEKNPGFFAPQLQKAIDEKELLLLINELASQLPFELGKKQQILEESDVKKQAEMLLAILKEEVEISIIRNELAEKVKKNVDKNQKDYLLREQQKVIREELGEDDIVSEADEYLEKCEALKASKEVKDKIKKEIKRYKKMPPVAAESTMTKNYIETMLEMPWNKVSRDSKSLEKAMEILEEDHYGLKKVKERILDYLAVRFLTKKGETPILFTFRTAKEGGERAIEPDEYVELNEKIAKSGYVDLVDVEAFTGDEVVKDIIEGAHAHDVKVVASNHDFDKTPAKSDIIYRLRKMQELGADIPKIAVMPQNKKDVLTLLAATEEMVNNYADRPIITMSMAGTGVISRLCGEVFGSSMTFGAAKKASAPGQMGVEDLSTVLGLLHKSM